MRISDWSSDVCSSDLAGTQLSFWFRGEAGWKRDLAFDSARLLWQGAPVSWEGRIAARPSFFQSTRVEIKNVVKPEWGTKRTCPKCGTRFYDLQAEDPVTCISCGTAWAPEPVLKSKQPLPFEIGRAHV